MVAITSSAFNFLPLWKTASLVSSKLVDKISFGAATLGNGANAEIYLNQLNAALEGELASDGRAPIRTLGNHMIKRVAKIAGQSQNSATMRPAKRLSQPLSVELLAE